MLPTHLHPVQYLAVALPALLQKKKRKVTNLKNMFLKQAIKYISIFYLKQKVILKNYFFHLGNIKIEKIAINFDHFPDKCIGPKLPLNLLSHYVEYIQKVEIQILYLILQYILPLCMNI